MKLNVAQFWGIYFFGLTCKPAVFTYRLFFNYECVSIRGNLSSKVCKAFKEIESDSWQRNKELKLTHSGKNSLI